MAFVRSHKEEEEGITHQSQRPSGRDHNRFSLHFKEVLINDVRLMWLCEGNALTLARLSLCWVAMGRQPLFMIWIHFRSFSVLGSTWCREEVEFWVVAFHRLQIPINDSAFLSTSAPEVQTKKARSNGWFMYVTRFWSNGPACTPVCALCLISNSGHRCGAARQTLSLLRTGMQLSSSDLYYKL